MSVLSPIQRVKLLYGYTRKKRPVKLLQREAVTFSSFVPSTLVAVFDPSDPCLTLFNVHLIRYASSLKTSNESCIIAVISSGCCKKRRHCGK